MWWVHMPVYDCEIEQHGRSKLTQRSEEEKDFSWSKWEWEKEK